MWGLGVWGLGVWADSHCHIGYAGVGEEAIPEARAAGVTRLIDVGTGVVTSATAIETARTHEGVWATVGLHPHEASEGAWTVAGLLGSLSPVAGPVAEGLVVAVGECGLDYYYEHSPRDAQRSAFAEQIALAKQHGLALVIHTRDAWDDTWDILAGEGMPERTVFHCFTGGPVEARKALDLGAWLSFSGIITFKTAGDLREAAQMCPAARMLVETDSPFLAPVPYRGKPNRPALVTVVGAALASIRGEPVEAIEAATWSATAELFGLPE